MDEREQLIISQSCIKAAAQWAAERDVGYAEVMSIAEAFERWCHEAPKRALTNQTNRLAPAPGTTVLPQPVPQQAPVVQPQPLEQPSGPSYACPRCSAPMKLRNSSYGQFYGCTNFPECKGTRDIGGKVKTG